LRDMRATPVEPTLSSERNRRFGGADGNETLTSAVAIVLTVLLIAEECTS
jgi:hypothetical protein